MALDGDEVDDDDDRDMFCIPPNLWVNAKANTAKATHQSLARSKAPHSFFASFISCLLLFIFVSSLPYSTLRSPLQEETIVAPYRVILPDERVGVGLDIVCAQIGIRSASIVDAIGVT